jgi:hypothetical protein
MTVVTLPSKIALNAFVAEFDRRAHADVAEPQLFSNALEDQHVGVDGHTDGEHDAGDAGQGQRGAEGGHAGEHEEHVEQPGRCWRRARRSRSTGHEEHDRAKPTMTEVRRRDRVGAERGADLAVVDLAQRGLQRAALEHGDEGGGLLLKA